MITVDDRTGSKELYSMLKSAPAQLGHLESADFSFLGRGENDTPLAVGIERKKIRDLLTSMSSGRLSGHQAPLMLRTYHVNYLIIEGYHIPDPHTGILKEWKRDVMLGSRRFGAKEVFGYLNTLQIRRGIYLWRTHTPRETAQLVLVLYGWWTKKNLDQHLSYLAQHKEFADLCTKQKPFIERVATELPGVGRERAKEVLKHFKTLKQMVEATEKDWMSIDGIGKTLAKNIREIIHG